MSKNFKNRFYTSIILLSLLFFMIKSNLMMGYILLILSIISLIEFNNMLLIIFNKEKIKRLFINMLFTIYIFLFIYFFWTFSFYTHLKILTYVILITCIASDIGGYIFGKIFGGKKLTRISPKKTISGAVGSLILSSFSILIIIFYLTNNLNLYTILIGTFCSIGCQVGDIFFSYMKRKSFLKDTGNILPGHGGVLDRIDGILFGVPIGFLSLYIFY